MHEVGDFDFTNVMHQCSATLRRNQTLHGHSTFECSTNAAARNITTALLVEYVVGTAQCNRDQHFVAFGWADSDSRAAAGIVLRSWTEVHELYFHFITFLVYIKGNYSLNLYVAIIWGLELSVNGYTFKRNTCR